MLSLFNSKSKTHFLGKDNHEADKNYDAIKPLFGMSGKAGYALDVYVDAYTQFMRLETRPSRDSIADREVRDARDLCIKNTVEVEKGNYTPSFSMGATFISDLLIDKSRNLISGEEPQVTDIYFPTDYKLTKTRKMSPLQKALYGVVGVEKQAINAHQLFSDQLNKASDDKTMREVTKDQKAAARIICNVDILNEVTLQMVRNMAYEHMLYGERSVFTEFKNHNPAGYNAAMEIGIPLGKPGYKHAS